MNHRKKRFEFICSEFYKNFETFTERLVGVELEFPLSDVSGNAPELIDRNDFFRNVKKNIVCENVIISEEMGLNLIEIGVGPCRNLIELSLLTEKVLSTVVEIARKYEISILGYGVNPFLDPSKEQVSKKGVYHLFERFSQNSHLDKSKGADIHLFTIAASCQVHVDVGKSEAVDVLNYLNLISGIQLALTGNSEVYKGELIPECLALREKFYDICYNHQGNRYLNQYGTPPYFNSLDDYLIHILEQPMTTITRGDESYYIEEEIKKIDFLYGQKVTGKSFENKILQCYSKDEDVTELAGQVEYCARLSPKYGTVESRISCQQPPGESMVVPALILGCIENKSDLNSFIISYDKAELYSFRDTAMSEGLDNLRLKEAAKKLLDIAFKGLKGRKLGEESFLGLLYCRLSGFNNSLNNNVGLFKSKSRLDFIEKISY